MAYRGKRTQTKHATETFAEANRVDWVLVYGEWASGKRGRDTTIFGALRLGNAIASTVSAVPVSVPREGVCLSKKKLG